MAVAVLSPTAMSPRSGILLNSSPCNSPALAHCIPQTPSSQSLSSSMSETSTNSWFNHSGHGMHRSASAPGTSHRRIRFAPLPDPRADESDDTSVTEPSEESGPISSSKLLATEGTELLPKVSPSSSASSTHSTITAPPKKPGLNLLHPLKLFKRAPSPCPSAGSDSEQGSSRLARISTEDILTLGTINLFRPSSRTTLDSDRRGRRYSDSSPENDPDSSCKKRSPRLGLNGPSTSPHITSQPLGRARSAPSSPQQGITMLNGRVYGGRRKSKRTQNLFASARDEPEFVEWGYGGMGSVHADHSGNSMYRNLQSRGTALFEGDNKTGNGSRNGGGTVVEDEDDGSGMMWVKRRREQREREKKEAEERERAAREAQKQKDQADDADVESGAEEKAPAALNEPPAEETEAESTRVTSPDSENHHILNTVAIPVHHRHHSHSSHHKSPSLSRVTSPSPESEGLVEAVSETISPTEEDEKDSTESSNESDSEVEDNKDEDEDDEDDAEDVRKTAMSAGMEKISRHRDER